MAERNPGPVKPPTIDLVARETVVPAAAPETPVDPAVEEPAIEAKRPRARKTRPADAGAEADVPPQLDRDSVMDPDPEPFPEPPPPLGPAAPVRATVDWGQIGAAAVIGALFGTALTYIVATIVPMPSRAPVYDDPAPALADQATRVGTIEERLGILEESAIDTQVSLDATIAQLDSGMTEVRQEIAAATAAATAAQRPVVDTSAIEDRLRALSARLDAVAAGASSADAGALAENLSDLEEIMATLRTEVTAIGQRAEAARTGVINLEQSVAAIETQMATLSPPPPPGPSIGEVALNGLEAAFAAGRPYASELEALSRIAPDAMIPQTITDAARSGLPAPDVIADRFAAVVPDMLTADRPPADADWQDTAASWLTNLLAIRPAGEVEGNTPDAVMARLETAMARRDFVAADALFAQLPAGMRTAAGTIPADVALHAEAAGWVAALRKRPAEVAP